MVDKQEVLRLEVSVHHPERMARLDDTDDHPRQLRGRLLGVVPALHDPIKQLPASAELHDEVHGDGVLVRADDGDHARVAGEVVHDLDLPAHVLHVLLADQLPLGDGLAGEHLPRGLLHALVRGPELPLPELLPQGVEVLEPLGVALEDGVGEEPRALDAPHLGLIPALVGGGGGEVGVGDGDALGRRGRGDGGVARLPRRVTRRLRR
ncbi:Os07g0161650, partial [Oryza sativa Japonica Group]